MKNTRPIALNKFQNLSNDFIDGSSPLFRGFAIPGSAIPGFCSRLLPTVTLGFTQFGLDIARLPELPELRTPGIADSRSSGPESLSIGLSWSQRKQWVSETGALHQKAVSLIPFELPNLLTL